MPTKAFQNNIGYSFKTNIKIVLHKMNGKTKLASHTAGLFIVIAQKLGNFTFANSASWNHRPDQYVFACHVCKRGKVGHKLPESPVGWSL